MTSLAYIDDTLDRAIDVEHVTPKIPQSQRDEAAKKAHKIVAGFRVYDEEAEKKALDDLIAARRAAIEQFRLDRGALRESLDKLGVTPLAVVPTKAWTTICKNAGLYLMYPDKDGKVYFARAAFKDYKEPIDRDRLSRMFPGRESGTLPARHWSQTEYAPATLILPDPPEDVANILCRVQALTLKVAAVAEAISFAETPSELAKASINPKDLWAQEQGYADYADWVKRDPIIYTDQGMASAIIAQFGDFPIEKQVVDAVVANNDLIGNPPDLNEMYRQAAMQHLQAGIHGGSQFGVF